MKKTIMEMIEEMFAENFDEVYTLGMHKYSKYKRGIISKEEIENFIRIKGPHRIGRWQVEPMYQRFINTRTY